MRHNTHYYVICRRGKITDMVSISSDRLSEGSDFLKSFNLLQYLIFNHRNSGKNIAANRTTIHRSPWPNISRSVEQNDRMSHQRLSDRKSLSELTGTIALCEVS